MAASKHSSDEPSPMMLGGFRLVELLGRGGMGEVYRAERDGPGGYKRRAAIKRILPRFQNDPTLRARFLAEARITARLDHPNIVQVLDFGDDPEPYLALEYVDGINVARVLKVCADHNARLPAVAAAYLVAEAATGLDYAHRRKGEQGEVLDIVHRDVSPQNILISVEGAVKISDFGIARAADNQHRTAQGISVGKLAYMAPEQAQGHPIDRRADVFALGIVLWEALLVRPLIPRNDPNAAIGMLTRGGFDPPSRVDPKIPPVFDRIVSEALEIDPSRRTASAGQLAQNLRAFVHSVAPGFDGHELVRILAKLVPDVPWQDDGAVAPWAQRAPLPAPAAPAYVGEGVDAFAPAPASPIGAAAPAPIAARPPPQSAQPPTRVSGTMDPNAPVPAPVVRGLPPTMYGPPPARFSAPLAQPSSPAPPTSPANVPGYAPPSQSPSVGAAWASSAPEPAPPSTRRSVLIVLLTVGFILLMLSAMAVAAVTLLHRGAAGEPVPAEHHPNEAHPSQRAPVRVPTIPSVPSVPPAAPVAPVAPAVVPVVPVVQPPAAVPDAAAVPSAQPPPSAPAGPDIQVQPQTVSFAALAESALRGVTRDVRRCSVQFPDAAERSAAVEATFDNATGTAHSVRVSFHVAHPNAPSLRQCIEQAVSHGARFAPPAGSTGVTPASHTYSLVANVRRSDPGSGMGGFIPDGPGRF